MHSSYHLWDFISSSLQNNTGVILMYVLNSNGSSPGRQGFAMAVNAEGSMHGSIGGGIMEHKFVEMCRDMFLNPNELKPFIRKQYHDKSVAKDQSGMICSGNQTNFIYPVKEEDLIHINAIKNCFSSGKNGILRLTQGVMTFSPGEMEKDFHFLQEEEGSFLYEEKIGFKNRLTVIGGGHCSLALCRLMSRMDFFIDLFETRSGLNTMQANSFAHQAFLIDDYSELKELVQPGDNHYVVVMTFGYRSDDIATRAMLGKPFKFFGVLGSGYKIKKLFSDYIAGGYDESLIRSLHAPVGLPINSRTPEEIAVSIAAEIIQVKNKN
jgi:xanthine dehydrogenase accessory factor